MIQQPSYRGRTIDQFLRGAIVGILAGGCSGIIACCATNALGGAVMAYTNWHQFTHPLGAILISAFYLGCLALPIGLVVAVPSGLLMGSFIGYCQATGKRIWPAALTGMTSLFVLLESLNHWSQAAHPHLALLPGQWQQHLAALAGVTVGLVYWSKKHPVRWRHSKH